LIIFILLDRRQRMGMILYEDQYFYITKCDEYPNVPGMFAIYETGGKWYSSEKSIKRLAAIEKKLETN
jgi:hypothetical protein